MSKEEVMCSSLDNTSINPEEKENILKNSCSTNVVKSSLLNFLENGDEINDEIASGEISDREEFEEDIMTGSYGEISLEQELNMALNKDSKREKDVTSSLNDSEEENETECIANQKKRPDSLILSKNSSLYCTEELQCNKEVKDEKLVHKSQQTCDGQTTSAEVSPSFCSEESDLSFSGGCKTGSDASGLSELQGTLTVDGDLVMFVAEDLQEKIKMSSPVSRKPDSSFPGSRSSTPSLYKQALQTNLHIIDPNILIDLELHSKKVATCVDTMLENLSGTLQSISSLTVDCMETYEKSVCKTCDAVDSNIKAVYQLMAKCEELSNSMTSLYKISEDVKNIKAVLDHLEHAVEHKS